MSRRSHYNLQNLYQQLLNGGDLYVNLKEASAIYQYVNRNGGKIQRRYGDTGCYVKLIRPMSGLVKESNKSISVEQLMDILRESNGKIAVSISISIR